MISAHSREAKLAFSNDQAESAYNPDMATKIDNETEVMSDRFIDFLQKTIPSEISNLSMSDRRLLFSISKAAGSFGLLIEMEKAEDLSSMAWEKVSNVISYILMAKNVKAAVLGLAFSWGLDQLNGLHSMAEVAKKMGVTRALISHYKKSSDNFFGNDIRKFGKSPEAVEKYKKHGGSLSKLTLH